MLTRQPLRRPFLLGRHGPLRSSVDRSLHLQIQGERGGEQRPRLALLLERGDLLLERLTTYT